MKYLCMQHVQRNIGTDEEGNPRYSYEIAFQPAPSTFPDDIGTSQIAISTLDPDKYVFGKFYELTLEAK